MAAATATHSRAVGRDEKNFCGTHGRPDNVLRTVYNQQLTSYERVHASAHLSVRPFVHMLVLRNFKGCVYVFVFFLPFYLHLNVD